MPSGQQCSAASSRCRSRPGISDEHRHKLLRIARKLGKPFIYTERRLLERLGAFAAQQQQSDLFESLRARCFLVDELEAIGRPGKVYRARPEDAAFIQFSSGSTSQPKGVVLTHANLMANIRGVTAAAKLRQDDVGLSWMPLTHDMGLIGFHLMMFANRMHAHLMPTELFVRRPLLWLQLRQRDPRQHPVFAQFRLPALSEGARRARPRRARSFERAADLQWRRAD